MNYSLITVRYTKALFQLSDEENVLDAVKSDIEGILASIRDSEDFTGFLESPLIKSSDKLRIMDKIFSNKVHALTLKFIHLLFTQKREAHLPDVCRNFIQQYKNKSGVQEAVIITAQALTEDNRKEINDFIINQFKINIELSEKVDQKIIGGFILRIEDQQINASIQSQLNKIKRELINS